ncbi:hypothetical protein AB3N00_02645 [Paenibacillus xylanilyticus]
MGCSSDKQIASSLSDERIAELRKEYPLSQGNPSPAQTIDVPFDQILEMSDSVVDENYVLSAYQGESEERKSFTKQTDGNTLNNLVEQVKELWTN